MRVHMYVYVYVCMRVYMYVCARVYVCVCMYVSICVCMCAPWTRLLYSLGMSEATIA